MSKEEKLSPPVRAGDPRLSKQEEPAVLNEEAFSIAFSPTKGYFLVTLKYNLETGDAQIAEKAKYDSRGEAFERFKIKVAESKMVNG